VKLQVKLATEKNVESELLCDNWDGIDAKSDDFGSAQRLVLESL
jgi:hypothetical protein